MSKTVGDIAQQKVDAQTQLDIFNKLTNNGELQGLFMQDGRLYVNAQYLRGDTIDLNVLKLVGTLCGLMQGYGSTPDGKTTVGIVTYANGLDTDGNAKPPYQIVTNAGWRVQLIGDYQMSYANGALDVYGIARIHKVGEQYGSLEVQGKLTAQDGLNVSGGASIRGDTISVGVYGSDLSHGYWRDMTDASGNTYKVLTQAY